MKSNGGKQLNGLVLACVMKEGSSNKACRC